jgi:phage tail-like protein
MLSRYPPVGFHFIVAFELFPQSPFELGFQEVSGLSVDMETESYKEGGENRFVHQLPLRAKYEDLVLKRGLLAESGIILWCLDAINNFVFKPINIMVSLQNEHHVPVYSWYVINAFPKKWSVSNFNAQENNIVVESLTLGYQYFKPLNLMTAVTGALDVSVSASASVSI